MLMKRLSTIILNINKLNLIYFKIYFLPYSKRRFYSISSWAFKSFNLNKNSHLALKGIRLFGLTIIWL